MRTRQIKPTFWTDPDVANLTRAARLLFIGLWCDADEHGYLEDDAAALRLKLFPGDWDLDDGDVADHLDELIAKGMVIRVRADDGVRLLRVVNFRKHQSVNRKVGPRYAVAPAPEPQDEGPRPRTRVGAARRAESRIPRDYPDRLRPYVEPVRAILREVAAANGAEEPTEGAVARALADYPRRDFLPVARKYRAWQLDDARTKHRRVVTGFRAQLDMAPDVVRPEPPSSRPRLRSVDDADYVREAYE